MQNAASDLLEIALVVMGYACFIVAILFTAKFVYQRMPPKPLPLKRPHLGLLPKYAIYWPLTDLSEIAARLAHFGFREIGHKGEQLVFQRSRNENRSQLKGGTLCARVVLPLTQPVQINMEYKSYFGLNVDSGKLWRFCNEMMKDIDLVDAPSTNPETEWVESGNPFQSPST